MIKVNLVPAELLAKALAAPDPAPSASASASAFAGGCVMRRC